MSLLLNDRAVVLQPALVRRLGILEAALVQQLHYWAQRATRVHEGQMWVSKTYGDWADEIGVTAKAARGALDRLRRDGVVTAIQNPTDARDRTLWWRIEHGALEPGGEPSAPAGSSSTPDGQMPSAPAGSSRALVPSPPSGAQVSGSTEMTQENARTRAEPTVSYRGSRVPPDVVAAAVRLLEVLGELVGGVPGPWTRDRKATPALKQVIGAVLAREADAATWERGIRAFVADPPSWAEGQLVVGTVFGERAAEWVLRAADSPRMLAVVPSAQAQPMSARDREFAARAAQHGSLA